MCGRTGYQVTCLLTPNELLPTVNVGNCLALAACEPRNIIMPPPNARLMPAAPSFLLVAAASPNSENLPFLLLMNAYRPAVMPAPKIARPPMVSTRAPPVADLGPFGPS